MKESILDDLDIIILGNNYERSTWIHEQSDKDIYEVGCWLMNHLTPNYSERNHDRSNLRDLLYSWNGQSWTAKQKHYLGHSIIDFWPLRQQEQDPRYAL